MVHVELHAHHHTHTEETIQASITGKGKRKHDIQISCDKCFRCRNFRNRFFKNLFSVFETRSHCVTPSALEVALWTRLVLNAEGHLPLSPKGWD